MKRKSRAAVADDFVDGIAGGAGDGRDDGAGFSDELIQERGLADVGMSDDGNLDLVWFFGGHESGGCSFGFVGGSACGFIRCFG